MSGPGEFDLSTITLRDLKDLEGMIGKPIGSLFAALSGGDVSELGADLMAGLFWLRLRKDNPELTLDAVWDMDLGGLNPGPKAPADATA
jgi:hypothetical protein